MRNRIQALKHYYSHFMNKSQKPNTLDGIELYKLTGKLRILLICCVLSFIGMDGDFGAKAPRKPMIISE